MPVIRLLVLAMFFSLCPAAALGQSEQNSSSDLVVFEGAASMSPLIAADLNADSESRTTSNQLSVKDHSLLADASDEWGNSNDPSHGMLLGPDVDKTCYFIRDYVVIRDSPHSDVTHRDGSFTCVPGSRFRVYTTAEKKVKAEK